MILSFAASGLKEKVLRDLPSIVEDAKDKYNKECLSVQVPLVNASTRDWVFTDGSRQQVKHEDAPLPNKTGNAVFDAALESIKEQLAHVDNDEDVAVSFNITVHRPNQKPKIV